MPTSVLPTKILVKGSVLAGEWGAACGRAEHALRFLVRVRYGQVDGEAVTARETTGSS